MPRDLATGHIRTRPLGAADMNDVEHLLLALDSRDRHARFHLGVSDWWIGAYVAGLDPARMILVGGFAGRRLIGLAEAHPATSAPIVEMAITVHPSHRRTGVGSRLLCEALDVAFARGAEAAEFAFAPDNTAMARLVSTLGAMVTAIRGHAVIGRTNDIGSWQRAA